MKVAEMLKDELKYRNMEEHYKTESEALCGYISTNEVCMVNRIKLVHDQTKEGIQRWSI